jgi:MGT family glycosyltransferase
MAYRYLHICCTPPTFFGTDARFPDTARFIRHVDAPRIRSSAELLNSLDRGKPTVIVSLGTIFFRTPGLLETIVAALRNEAVNLLVTIGHDQDPLRLGPQPKNVHAYPYLPISNLLPSCDLFITHGGFNSVKEALTAGVPMLVVPLASDQHFSAERCEATGIGLAVRPHERTEYEINAKALTILSDARYKDRAEGFAREMSSLPPIEQAVSLLEGLARLNKAVLSS